MNETETLYSAEDAVANWLRQALDQNGLITVNKREYSPEPERKFGQVEDIQRYVDHVLSVLRENGHDFNGRQNVAVAVRKRQGNTKATYSHAEREIAIPPYENGGGWALREMVVLHEIAHHLNGFTGHGPDFRATFLRLLEAVGKHTTAQMMHESYVNTGLSSIGHEVPETALEKIAKLLRQAEGTDNTDEAEAFTAMAQKLATKHSIALAVARATAAKREEREDPVVEHYSIALPRQRGNQERVFLIHHISQVNDVRLTIYNGNTAVDMYGFQSDIDVVKALYESLSAQMEIAYSDLVRREPVAYEERQVYIRDSSGNIVRDDRGRGLTETIQGRKIHGTTRRVSFYDGFQTEVGMRLRQARDEAQAEIVEESSETSIVLRGKELEISDFYAERTKDIRGKWQTQGRAGGSGYDSGRTAGRSASLGTERAIG